MLHVTYAYKLKANVCPRGTGYATQEEPEAVTLGGAPAASLTRFRSLRHLQVHVYCAHDLFALERPIVIYKDVKNVVAAAYARGGAQERCRGPLDPVSPVGVSFMPFMIVLCAPPALACFPLYFNDII